MSSFASAGSQKWLQIAVNRKPQLLLNVLRLSGAVGPRISITWNSPLEADGFREYRDGAALKKTKIDNLKKPLEKFWPARGPVWDALGITSGNRPLFIEAKAHIPEAATPGTKAVSKVSRALIKQSLGEAKRFYAPKTKAVWSELFYQYANRLAYHYFLTQLNTVSSTLVFLYFINASDKKGPTSEEEWRGAVQLIHAALGLPKELNRYGIFDAFLDVNLLQDVVDSN